MKNLNFEKAIVDILKTYLKLDDDVLIQKANIEVGIDELPKISLDVVYSPDTKKELKGGKKWEVKVRQKKAKVRSQKQG